MLATMVYLHAQGFTHCGLRLKSFKFEQSEKGAFGTVMSAKKRHHAQQGSTLKLVDLGLDSKLKERAQGADPWSVGCLTFMMMGVSGGGGAVLVVWWGGGGWRREGEKRGRGGACFAC
jgi:hypothetical protein